MPISYHFFPAVGVVVCQHRGPASDEELVASYRDAYEDPRFGRGFAKLVDLRQSQHPTWSADALSKLAWLARERYPEASARVKTAIVARDDLSFGLGRMYEGLSSVSAEEVMVFREPEAACAWLGVGVDLLEGLGGEDQD